MAQIITAIEEKILLILLPQYHSGSEIVRIYNSANVRTGEKLSPSTVHPSLKRLEKKGLVYEYKPDTIEPNRGKPRKFYRISKQGAHSIIIAEDIRNSLCA